MLSEAKHLSVHRERPFASLRVTTRYRCWVGKFIIGPYRGSDYFCKVRNRAPTKICISRYFPEKDWEMHFTFRQMNEQDARAIAEWHYDGPYAFYDWDRDADDLAELLNPPSWEEKYYAVLDGQSELAGFFGFTKEGETVEIGLGLRPDLTGKGKGVGLEFVEAGLEFAKSKYAVSAFRLRVATFNQRAIRVYEQAGFRPLRVFMHETNGGKYEFLEMVMP